LKSAPSLGTAERDSSVCQVRYPNCRPVLVIASFCSPSPERHHDACCLFSIRMKRASTAPGVGSDPLGPVEGTMGEKPAPSIRHRARASTSFAIH